MCDAEELLMRIRESVHIDSNRIIRFDNVDSISLFDNFRSCVIESVVGNDISTIYHWISHTKKILDELTKLLNIPGYTFSKEFSSFLLDPFQHLKKKIFNYAYDLVRKGMGLEDFYSKVLQAITTSIRTNLRSCYQIWALASIMKILGGMGYTIAYPENRYLNFDRSGKQKLGVIPPNFILFNIGKGYLSFFHEAPRPLSWEDTSDLQKVWGLYTALRLDVMVYSGRVLDIVNLSNNPPIERPQVILEFKELEDWWKRARDLRGYFRKPLTAEEWKSKWIEGLFEGLGEAMSIKKTEVRRRIEEGSSLRVKEYQLILLYKSTYKPNRIVLVSRKEIPANIKKWLLDAGIDVIDSVEFNEMKLEDVAQILDGFVSFGSVNNVVIEVSRDVAKKLEDIRRLLGFKDLNEVLDYLFKVFNAKSGGNDNNFLYK
ncbi:MAG: hypothetical protein QXT53_05200 [Ignisphaera sp.]